MTDLYPAAPVLIVDDEKMSLTALDFLLRIDGITNTVLCNDSRNVQTELEKQNFSAVLLDLSMPHLSGLELLLYIRNNYPDIPTIVVTGQTSVQKAMKCLTLGAFEYILKPVDRYRLIKRVWEAIETRASA